MSKYMVIYQGSFVLRIESFMLRQKPFMLKYEIYNSEISAAKSCKEYCFLNSNRRAYMIKYSDKLTEIYKRKNWQSLNDYLIWLIENWPRIDYNQIIDAEKKRQKRREKYIICLKKKKTEEWEKQRKIISGFFDISNSEIKYDPTILPTEELYFNSCK